MQIATAERLGCHHLTSGRLHQRRAAKEDGALVAHDDALIGHRGDVGTASGARAHHHGNLRDARRRHIGLIVENPPKMVAIREHLVLVRQIRPAGIDQINAGQIVLLRNLLRAHMLLHRQRKIRAAFDGGVVADDDAFAPRHPANPGDHARRRNILAIHAIGGEGGEFQEGRAGVEQIGDAVTRQQLAARGVAIARDLVAAKGDALRLGAQIGDDLLHHLGIGRSRRVARVVMRDQTHHAVSLNSSRPISMRRISLVPAPISYSLASRSRRPVA